MKKSMSIEEFADVAHALSDCNRLRAYIALRQGELCVCQLIALLELAPSTVSKHMLVLRRAGLVTSRKDSRWVYYRLADKGRNRTADRFAEFTLTTSGLDTGQDEKKLRAILNTDVSILCGCQRNNHHGRKQ